MISNPEVADVFRKRAKVILFTAPCKIFPFLLFSSCIILLKLELKNCNFCDSSLDSTPSCFCVSRSSHLIHRSETVSCTDFVDAMHNSLRCNDATLFFSTFCWQIVSEIRKTVELLGFVEVETPVLQVRCYPHSAFWSWHLSSDYLLFYGQDAMYFILCIQS